MDEGMDEIEKIRGGAANERMAPIHCIIAIHGMNYPVPAGLIPVEGSHG